MADQGYDVQPTANLMLDRLVRLIAMDGLTAQEMALVRSLKSRRKRSQVIDVTRGEFEQIKAIHNKLYNRTRDENCG